MNIADRFFRVVKSNINTVLQNLEDPEKVLDQAVNDMQEDLVKVIVDFEINKSNNKN